MMKTSKQTAVQSCKATFAVQNVCSSVFHAQMLRRSTRLGAKLPAHDRQPSPPPKRTCTVQCFDTPPSHDPEPSPLLHLPACEQARRAGDLSITAFINSFFAPFDAAVVAQRIVASERCATDPTYAYYGMTSTAAVQRVWDENNRFGRVLHRQIDLFYKTGERPAQANDDFALFSSFHERVVVARGWRVLATEYEMYEPVLRFRGVVDAVYERPDGQLVLIDWKRVNGNIDSTYGSVEFAQPPLDAVADTRLSKYALQLHAYRDVLQRKSTPLQSLRVAEMYIVNLHPALGSYECVDVSDARWVEHWRDATRCRWVRHVLDIVDTLHEAGTRLRALFCEHIVAEASERTEDDDNDSDAAWIRRLHDELDAIEGNDTILPQTVQRLRRLFDFFRSTQE